MGSDERRVYDLVAKRFLAVFHPDAVYERTRIETVVSEHVFRTSGRRLLEAGWKGVYGAEVQQQDAGEDDTGGDQLLPKLEQGEQVAVASVESMRKETQRWRPPARTSRTASCGRR
jgi:DNA topoisomerase-3